MLAGFRFLVGFLAVCFVVLTALRMSRGEPQRFWRSLLPRDPEEFHKSYGDRPPY